MTTYIVYRHGSNAANQSMCPIMVVGYEEAPNREAAKEQMAKRVSVYNNQYLSAKPVSRASEADRNAADEEEWAREALESAGAYSVA